MVALLALLALSGPSQPSCCCPSMAQFASDPAFLSAHQAPLPFKFQSREGRMVVYPISGGVASGYYVAPRGGVHTAVVMVHEFWGLNDYIKQEAVRLRDRTGYGVLAVDLYDGKLGKTAQEASALMQAVEPAHATAEVSGALQALTGGSLGRRFTKLGTIGWCFGGGWSLQTAILGGDMVKACVMYYGLPDDEPGHLAQLHAPVLLVEALQDKWISPEVVAKFKIAMSDAHRSLAVRTYDADHAFANPSNPHYNQPDAQDAMKATLRFLKENLG